MPGHTLSELASLTGLSPRTIRYYITQGLVPAPGREGRATRYPESTRMRLQLIARWRDEEVSLAQIRKRLDRLGDADMPMRAFRAAPPDRPRSVLSRNIPAPRSLAPDETEGFEPRSAERSVRFELSAPDATYDHEESAPMDSTTAETRQLRIDLPTEPDHGVGERSHWEHIRITTDIELHVRRPLGRRDNRIAARLMELAHELIEER
jgi:DNA-binding transcriptional MerR regulator